VGKTQAGEVHCVPWEEPHNGAEEEWQKEAAAETICNELTTIPSPHPVAPLGGEAEKTRSEAEPRKKRGVGEKVFKIWFYFSLP